MEAALGLTGTPMLGQPLAVVLATAAALLLALAYIITARESRKEGKAP